MTTDTNGAGGLPVSEKYDAYYDHPGNTCQYPGHMKLQYPNGEFHYLPAGTRLFIEHGELCRAAPAGGDECEVCKGAGTVDETLGGYAFSNPKATCPECDGLGEYRSAPAVSATRDGDIPDGSDVLFTLRMLEKLTANGKGEIADDAGCMWGVDQIAGQAIAIIRWAHRRTLSRVAVQEGMVLVPREPTDAMRVAGERERLSHPGNINPLTTWDAMIAAAQRQEGGNG